MDLPGESTSSDFLFWGTVSLESDPEQVGQNIRQRLNIDWKTQKKWKSKSEALN
jgi:hypothetical protein